MAAKDEEQTTYTFFVVVLALFIATTLMIFLIVNAVPPARDAEDFARLEERIIELEHLSKPASAQNPSKVPSVSGDKAIDGLALRLSLLETKFLEREKRISDRSIRIERKVSEVESSSQWQIAILWGIIIALSAAIIPLRLSNKEK